MQVTRQIDAVKKDNTENGSEISEQLTVKRVTVKYVNGLNSVRERCSFSLHSAATTRITLR